MSDFFGKCDNDNIVIKCHALMGYVNKGDGKLQPINILAFISCDAGLPISTKSGYNMWAEQIIKLIFRQPGKICIWSGTRTDVRVLKTNSCVVRQIKEFDWKAVIFIIKF